MTTRVRIAGVPDSDGEARAQLQQIFGQDAGVFFLKAPTGDAVRVRLPCPPAVIREARALWRQLFPDEGEYLLKAARVTEAEGQQFTEWWLERLMAEGRGRALSVHDRLLAAIERFIRQRAGILASADTWADLEHLLFDLRQAVRWSLGAPVSVEMGERLRALGFSERDVLDFAGIAYRMGLLEQRIAAAEGTPGATAFDVGETMWQRVLGAVNERPLIASEAAAMRVAQERAAAYLTPVLMRNGTVMTLAAAERERDLIREMAVEAVRRKMAAPAFARELYTRLDIEGVWRDWDRVARTEIHNARCRGVLDERSARERWTDETKLYRTLAAVPCNGCIRLYLTGAGTPRLYTFRELREADARGPNRGPSREWHITVGGTHPNCLDSPWKQYHAVLAQLFEHEAERWRPILAERGLAA